MPVQTIQVFFNINKSRDYNIRNGIKLIQSQNCTKKLTDCFVVTSEKVSINVTWLKKKNTSTSICISFNYSRSTIFLKKKNGFLLVVEYTGDVISLLFPLVSSFFCPFIAYCFKLAGYILHQAGSATPRQKIAWNLTDTYPTTPEEGRH